MIRLIVEAAIHWMQIGLPLKCLKVVVYTRHPSQPDKSVLELVKYFNALKKKWNKTWESVTVTQVRIYITTLIINFTTMNF